ncbi:MAG: hypothetical protein GYA58_10825 [Anaerolineaceae bacterium]|nr:hypothetical protein [Anaerolineaceae bacterium]
MNSLLGIFLPQPAENKIRGSKIPFYFLIAVALIGTVRSLIHLFAADGGAGSIAGLDLTVSGANEVIFAFALWGSSQLILALLQWLVIWRYRSLVPIMWGIQLLEIGGRMLVGRVKPVIFSHTPPGAISNFVYLALCVIMLAIILISNTQKAAQQQ